MVAVPDLPRTHNGKDSERAARDAVEGRAPVNEMALRNPEVLPAIRTAVESAGRERERRRQEAHEAAAAGQEGEERGLVDELATTYSLVLGVPAGPDESFFDLGGTSIMITELCEAIERRTGHVVALSTVFGAPTPHALARRSSRTSPPRPIRGDLAGGRPATAADLPDVRRDRRRPLLPAVRGSPPRRPTRLRNPGAGLDEDGDRDRTVEDMAESAIDSMRLVQPGGTYTLVGYSFGGLLAHEVAHRLLASGMDVDLVLLVDSYLDNGVLSPAERRRFVLWSAPPMGALVAPRETPAGWESWSPGRQAGRARARRAARRDTGHRGSRP